MIVAAHAAGWRCGGLRSRPQPPFSSLVQPLLKRLIRTMARRHPQIFARLGPHTRSRFVVDPIDLPFALYLRPDPANLVLRAVTRQALPPHDARIAARFLQLLRMIDGAADGDAMFFARTLSVSGDTEAVVSLRNAVDDMDGSLAKAAAEVFGPAGQIGLSMLRAVAERIDG